MSRWYRAYEGTVTDEKIGEAALIADVTRSVTIATWHCILESASKVGNCGSYDTSPRRIASILGEPPAKIDELFAAFSELGMVKDGAVASWKKRQYQSDDSKQRVRQHRERKKAETLAPARVTACNGDVTAPETEPDTEKEEEAPNGACASGDAPALKPEHVVERWNGLAKKLGKPLVRDLTPERRVKLKARIAGYSLSDWREVISNIESSPFLRGDSTRRGDEGWKGCTFDWITKKANFQKVLEGNYNG